MLSDDVVPYTFLVLAVEDDRSHLGIRRRNTSFKVAGCSIEDGHSEPYVYHIGMLVVSLKLGLVWRYSLENERMFAVEVYAM